MHSGAEGPREDLVLTSSFLAGDSPSLGGSLKRN